MIRKGTRRKPTAGRVLKPLRHRCPTCGDRTQVHYHNYRSVAILNDVVRLTLRMRRCVNPGCEAYHKPCRPEAEGVLALPKHEFGLDIIALIGALRFQNKMSVPEIHEELCRCRVMISERSVTNVLERYEELLALRLRDSALMRGELGLCSWMIGGWMNLLEQEDEKVANLL